MRTMAFSIGQRIFKIQFSVSPASRQIGALAQLSGHAADVAVNESDHGRFSASRSKAVNFWEALSVSQQADFKAGARERTFAAGATLMQEGEQADHVVVIIRGRTKICVQENGQELVIAERGPGQLIGERAALRVGVRSATVIAQEMVWALAMTTEDFAAFVTAYPSILSIVESQVYDRLTQTPTSYQPRQPLHLDGENCTVLLTDVVGFGADARTDEDRLLIRKATSDMTQAVLGSLWSECHCEDRGDGLLIIAPPDITTATVMECINRLPYELKRHNHTYADVLKVQIRAAVDVGPVVSDDTGVAGRAIIHAARLLEAPELKEAINTANASLGVIASNFVYGTAIRQSIDSMEPDSYRQIQLNVKETDTTAWMLLTGKVTLIPPSKPLASDGAQNDLFCTYHMADDPLLIAAQAGQRAVIETVVASLAPCRSRLYTSSGGRQSRTFMHRRALGRGSAMTNIGHRQLAATIPGPYGQICYSG